MAAWINGAPAEVEAAVEAAAALLAPARAPVVAGLAADVDGIRAGFRLAEVIGASLDPIGAVNLYGDLAALAGAGAMRTTPSETIGRADVLLAVGGMASAAPILAEIEAFAPATGPAAGVARSVLLLGGPAAAGGTRSVYPADPTLPAAVGLLRALAGGRLRQDTPLAALAERLRGARYGVALYDPAELGEIAVEMLQGLIADLNQETRFFCLPLADLWQGQAVLQVSAWTTGQGPRVGFGRARPEHDPWRFDGMRQTAEGEADAAVWLAAVPAPRPEWTRALPSVALLGEAGGDQGDVVIALAVPGETSDGALWDERRGVIAFRPAQRCDNRPTAAAVLGALAEAVLRAREVREAPSC